MRDLSLSRHARRFEFYVASAMACVKIFAYFVKSFFQSIPFVTTLCYYFIVFPSGTEFLEVFGVFHLRSHYGRKLHFYFLFVSSTFSLLCISVNRNFYSRFVVHFSFYRICCVAQQLGNKEDFQQVKLRSHSLVKLANLDGLKQTFAEYSRQSFLPYIQSQLSHAKRLDVVWDEYIANSLKATIRSKRGQGARRRVQPSSQIPRNWQ